MHATSDGYMYDTDHDEYASWTETMVRTPVGLLVALLGVVSDTAMSKHSEQYSSIVSVKQQSHYSTSRRTRSRSHDKVTAWRHHGVKAPCIMRTCA